MILRCFLLLRPFERFAKMDSKHSPYFSTNLSIDSKGKVSKKRTSCVKATTIKLDHVPKTKMNIKEDRKSGLVEEHWVPENWEVVMNNIRTMRCRKDAPVDHMGAEQSADITSPPEVRRFQVLVSLMLSSQTKDQITFAAMGNLKKHGLTVENLLNTEESVVAGLIHPVGFWKKKASYIKRTAAILKEKYEGDIPKTVEELCQLPGVGQKMAVLCVNIAWESTVGIGVDTHVHRIAKRLGWTRTAKTPLRTQTELEDWLPRSLWNDVNVLLVGFGQQICTPVKPQCGSCLNRDLCPVGKDWVEPKK